MKSMKQMMAATLAGISFAAVAAPEPQSVQCAAGADEATLSRQQDGRYKLTYSTTVGHFDKYRVEGHVVENAMQCRFKSQQQGVLLASCAADVQETDVSVPRAGTTAKRAIRGQFEIMSEYRRLERVSEAKEAVRAHVTYQRGDLNLGEVLPIEGVEGRHVQTGERVKLAFSHRFSFSGGPCTVTP